MLLWRMILHAFSAPGQAVLASVKGFLQRADNLDLSHPSAPDLRHPTETGWPMPKPDTQTTFKTTNNIQHNKYKISYKIQNNMKTLTREIHSSANFKLVNILRR